MEMKLLWDFKKEFQSLKMRIAIFTVSQMAVRITYYQAFHAKEGFNEQTFVIDISRLLPGRYYLELITDIAGMLVKHDVLDRDVIAFEIQATEEKKVFRAANASWGYYELPETICK